MSPRLAVLIVNPAAGRAPLLRSQMSGLRHLLATHGYESDVRETCRDQGSAAQLARDAVRAGASLVLAAGGDGTVHGVLQGVACTDASLGVLPLGTANALARNLRLPLQPLAALERLLGYQASRIPLGRIEVGGSARFFAVMAGCGPDGTLAGLLAAYSGAKSRLGRNTYYLHAARLFLSRRWPLFHVEHRLPDDPVWRSAEAVALMISRVSNLGGLFAGLTPQASMASELLHVHLLHAPAHLSLPAWFSISRVGVRHRWATVVDVAELRCTAMSAQPVLAQADAEPLGALPLTVGMVPRALSLLLPPRDRSAP